MNQIQMFDQVKSLFNLTVENMINMALDNTASKSQLLIAFKGAEMAAPTKFFQSFYISGCYQSDNMAWIKICLGGVCLCVSGDCQPIIPSHNETNCCIQVSMTSALTEESDSRCYQISSSSLTTSRNIHENRRHTQTPVFPCQKTKT